jgi:catechol 2,3-dioxygenase-like lactoylglutathione lyase family enzyme
MDLTCDKDRISPVLAVSNVEAASLYFRDKLGFTIEQSYNDGWGRALVRRGTSQIVLVPMGEPGGCEIRVDDVDEMSAELVSRHAEFESGPMNQEFGQRDFRVRGPDNYEIRFWGIVKKAEGTASPPDETGDDNVPF